MVIRVVVRTFNADQASHMFDLLFDLGFGSSLAHMSLQFFVQVVRRIPYVALKRNWERVRVLFAVQSVRTSEHHLVLVRDEQSVDRILAFQFFSRLTLLVCHFQKHFRLEQVCDVIFLMLRCEVNHRQGNSCRTFCLKLQDSSLFYHQTNFV